MRDVRRGVRILPLKEIDVVTFFESEYPEETVVAVATKNSRRELTRRAQVPAIGGYPTLIVTHIVKSLVELLARIQRLSTNLQCAVANAIFGALV